MRLMHIGLSALSALALLACDPPGGTDAGPDSGAPLDGAPPDASLPDAALLDGALPDAGLPDASPPDATLPDAGFDAGQFCQCEATPDPCVTTECLDGQCVYGDAPDGTPCQLGGPGGPLSQCVAGVCTLGDICGDGLRLPSPLEDREGCDDGNTLPGDACAPDCTPTVLVVSSRPLEEDVPQAIAQDDAGTVLFVWSATMGEDLELRARRASAAGVFLSDELVIATGLGLGWDPHAVAIGMSEGFFVAWAAPNAAGDASDIVTRRILADGTPGQVRLAHADAGGFRFAPTAARTGDGFALAWVDGSAMPTVVELRSFTRTGAPAGAVERVTDGLRSAYEPALASSGATLLLAWTEEPPDFFERPDVLGLRVGVDANPFTISDLDGAEPAAATLESGDFAVSWVGRTNDSDGDIFARSIARVGTPPLMVPMTVDAADGIQRAPAIVGRLADNALTLHESGGTRRGLSLVHLGAAAPVLEAPALQGHLTSGQQGDAVLLRTTCRGAWVGWSANDAFGEPSAVRSFLAYLLADS